MIDLTAPAFAKLSRAAKSDIRRLLAEVEHLKRENQILLKEQGLADSPVQFQYLLEPTIGLNPRGSVRFQLSDRDHIEVRLRQNHGQAPTLEVMGMGGISITPQASNVVQISMQEDK